MIDKTKVGLMGHSWGGYQTTFLITQTEFFDHHLKGQEPQEWITEGQSYLKKKEKEQAAKY